MKNLIAMLLLAFAVVAQAEGPVLARYEYATEWGEGASPNTVRKYEVGVDEGGVAQLNVYRLDSFRGSIKLVATETKNISRNKQFKTLKTKLERLYTTNVDTTRRMRVCMRMPKATDKFRNLFVRDGSSDDVRLILSNEGCWMRTVTRPTDDRAAEDARSAKELLQKIGNSFRL